MYGKKAQKAFQKGGFMNTSMESMVPQLSLDL